MNGWTVELMPVAKKELRQLDGGPRQAALDLIEELREFGPSLLTSIELDALPNNWRARFHESYRIVYQVSRIRKHILVTRIRPRPTAYVGMKKPGLKKRNPKPGSDS